MFNKGVPEKLIQERTGHRSVEALRQYERTPEEQKEMASKIMNTTNQQRVVPFHPTNQKTMLQPTLPFRQVQPPPPQPNQPSFSGCTLSGCSVTINIVQPPAINELQGLDVQDIFADFLIGTVYHLTDAFLCCSR